MLRWALFLLLLGVLSAGLTGCSSPPAEQDSWRVFCLAPARGPALAQAAVALGVADAGTTSGTFSVSGKDATAEQWRSARRKAFDRACAALVGAQSPESSAKSGNALVSALGGILPVLAGGLLTLGGALVQAKVTDSRRRAETLRAAGRGFARASRAYLDAWAEPAGKGRPDRRDVGERADDLAAELRSLRSGRSAVPPLRDELAGLRDALLDGPPALGGAAREQWTERMRRSAADLETGVERVAAALEHPLRTHRVKSADGGAS